MTKVSSCATAACALIPCFAEAFYGKPAMEKGNMIPACLASGLIGVRNEFYFKLLVLMVAGSSAYRCDPGWGRFILLSASLMGLYLVKTGSEKLYEAANEFKENYYHPERYNIITSQMHAGFEWFVNGLPRS